MQILDILCCGELTIDEISEASSFSGKGSIKLKSTGRFFGGRGGNLAVYAALTGLKVGIVGSVGNDPDGADYRSHLQAKRIDISHLYKNMKAHTCKCFIFNNDMDSKIFFYGGALVEEREEYLEHLKKSIRTTEHKMICCSSPDAEVNAMLLRESDSEIKAFAPSSNIYSYSREDAAVCLDNTNILFLNVQEADFLGSLFGMDFDELLERFRLDIMVETLGSRGSRVITGDSVLEIRPFKGLKVVDANGAGDSFAGAFMADYYDSEDVAHAGRFASAAASFVVEEKGCQSRIPTMENILERIEAQIE